MGDADFKATKLVLVGAAALVAFLIWQRSIDHAAFEEVCQSYANMVQGYTPFDGTKAKIDAGYEYGVSRLDRDPKGPAIYRRPSAANLWTGNIEADLARFEAEFQVHEQRLNRSDELGYAYRDWWHDVETIRENCRKKVQISF